MSCSGRYARSARCSRTAGEGFARQLAIFIPFDIAYELSRRVATGGEETALQHARDVVDAEQSLGIYHELAVQHWALDAPDFVMEVAKFTYFQCQFTITFGFVLWVYVSAHYAYTLLRNVLFTTFMLALPGYILYPTAPPRMLPDEGFVDALADGGAQPAAASSSRSSATPTPRCRACTRPPPSSSARPACS